MTAELIALLASFSFALFAVYGWLGLRCAACQPAYLTDIPAGKEQVTGWAMIGTVAVVWELSQSRGADKRAHLTRGSGEAYR